MLLNVCTKNEVCRFNRIWNMDICMEKTYRTSAWQHHPFDFYYIQLHICKGHIYRAYWISVWSDIRELKYTVGKLTKNYEKKWILSHCDLDLWPKVNNFDRVWDSVVSSHLAKTASKSVHSFGWNLVHKNSWTHTHRHTHTQTNCSENITPPRFSGGVIIEKITL